MIPIDWQAELSSIQRKMNNLKEEAQETGEKVSNYLLSHLKSLEKEAKREMQKHQLRTELKKEIRELIDSHEDDLIRSNKKLDDFRYDLNSVYKLSNEGFKGEAKRALTKKFSKATSRCSEHQEDVEGVSKTFKLN